MVFIGIKKRGVHLAARIAKNIYELEGYDNEIGKLDITFYRDDIAKKINPQVEKTDLPFDVDDRDVVLVDDVLFTGRTVRAALDAIIGFGRPSSIQLVVLIDRGHRQLPIRADYVGKNIPTALNETILVQLAETDGKDRVTICESGI